MANGTPSPENFTIKEILTNFIQPTLEDIREKLDTKADVTDLKRLETEVEKLNGRVENIAKVTSALPSTLNRVNEIEKQVTTPERVAQMVEEGLRASKQRGWSVRERVLAASIGLITVVTLILNVTVNLLK